MPLSMYILTMTKKNTVAGRVVLLTVQRYDDFRVVYQLYGKLRFFKRDLRKTTDFA